MKNATLNRIETLDYATREAVNTLCANLSFAGENMKRILFTSCQPSEGKTFLAMQIAMNLGRMGKFAVIVDTDLRRSSFVSQFDLRTEEPSTGLAHYLVGRCEMDEALYQTNQPGVCIIPAGRDVVNPISLLNSSRLNALMDWLETYFDVIIVDSPPIGLVIDAAVVAKTCDGSVLVVEYNKTRRRELQEAKQQMLQSGTPVLGCVINKVSFDTLSARHYYHRGYYSHYGYGHYARKGEAKKKDNT